MKGFEIKFNNETIYASIDNLHIIISDSKESSFYVGGIDKNKSEHVGWYFGYMDDIDTIKVKVVEVEQNSEIKDSHSTSNEVYALMEYQHLQKRLKKEGLI
jgi:hypothetical protein